MGVGLDGHELVHAHRTRLAHPPEIVALEVDQHDVLGALLGMRRELAHLVTVPARKTAAWPGAGDGARIDAASHDPHQPFGRGTEDGDSPPLAPSSARRPLCRP